MFHKLRIKISGGFLLLLAWYIEANGLYLTFVLLFAALAHELGHLFVLRMMGGNAERIEIGVLGAVICVKWTRFSYKRELAALLAGIGANFLCALVLLALDWDVAAGANLVLCLFNLLPVEPLDGGKILATCLEWAWGPNAGELARRWIGGSFALLLTAGIAGLVWYSRGSLWLLPAAGGLMSAAVSVLGGKCRKRVK